MTQRFSPTLRGWQLSRILVEMREAAGLSGSQAASEMGWQPSKISRLESGKRQPTKADVRALCSLYRADDRFGEVDRLRQQAGQQSVWDELGVPGGSYVDLESEARRIRSWDPMMIPGLLQTSDYARAVIEALTPDLSPAERAQRLKVRVRRFDLIKDPNPPDVWAVVSEAALLTRVGSPQVMAEQLGHLADLADTMGHVTIQVLPLDAGAHAGMEGPFRLLDFHTPRQLVYIESVGGAAWLGTPDEYTHVETRFNHVVSTALRPADSMALMRRMAERHDHGNP